MSRWRNWALILGGIVALCGIFVLSVAGNPMVLILGALIAITAALEPMYGQANGRPSGGSWQATDERFVEPETGKLVTVWFDRATGERRYVEDNQPHP
jgi:hypothetical protein